LVSFIIIECIFTNSFIHREEEIFHTSQLSYSYSYSYSTNNEPVQITNEDEGLIDETVESISSLDPIEFPVKGDDDDEIDEVSPLSVEENTTDAVRMESASSVAKTMLGVGIGCVAVAAILTFRKTRRQVSVVSDPIF